MYKVYKDKGVHFADFIQCFLNIPLKCNNLVSLRPNFLIFIGYLKLEGQGDPQNPQTIHSGYATD